MALGPGPLRTQQLTDRLSHLSSRSVYRHVGTLRKHGLVARREEPGVPSHVVLSLTDPLGRSLFRLLDDFVSAASIELRRRANGAGPWDSLGLFGEFWELGLIEELSHRPTSVIELAGKAYPMTYHQVNRRAALCAASGLVRPCASNDSRKRILLTDDGRRCVGLVSGIGRWLKRHGAEDGAAGLTTEEMTTVLRTALPLVRLREFAGRSVDLEVSNANGHGTPAVLRGKVGQDGAMEHDPPAEAPDGSAGATINTWFGVLLEGKRGRVKARGNLPLVDACLTQLHDVLWASESRLPMPAPPVAA